MAKLERTKPPVRLRGPGWKERMKKFLREGFDDEVVVEWEHGIWVVRNNDRTYAKSEVKSEAVEKGYELMLGILEATALGLAGKMKNVDPIFECALVVLKQDGDISYFKTGYLALDVVGVSVVQGE